MRGHKEMRNGPPEMALVAGACDHAPTYPSTHTLNTIHSHIHSHTAHCTHCPHTMPTARTQSHTFIHTQCPLHKFAQCPLHARIHTISFTQCPLKKFTQGLLGTWRPTTRCQWTLQIPRKGRRLTRQQTCPLDGCYS
jgi:hypothetical protein